MRSWSRMSASTSSAVWSRLAAASCRWVSSWSRRTSRSGPRAATWRAISEPIEPPAPVMSTRRHRRRRGRVHIDARLGPAEQVLDAQVAHAADRRPAVEDLADRREHLEGHTGGLGLVGDEAHKVAIGARDGEQDLLGAVLGDDRRQSGGGPDDRQPQQLPPLLAGVVVDHDHGHQPAVGPGEDLADDQGAGRPGADEGQAHAVALVGGGLPSQQPTLEPDGARQHRGEQGTQQHDRSGQGDRPERVQREQHRTAHRAGQHQTAGLAGARVAPQRAVDAEGRVGGQLDRDHDRQEVPRAVDDPRRDRAPNRT